MADALDAFFGAWSESKAALRGAAIVEAMAQGARYTDPRSGGVLVGADAIADYVGNFSANAPGWSATVDARADVNGFARARVAFGGPGPDGTEMTQMGTYFAEFDEAGKISLLAGFVGAEA